MKATNPNNLKEPFDIAEVDRMVQSWRGIHPDRVPGSVKIIADLVLTTKHAAKEIRDLQLKVEAQRELMYSIGKELAAWNDLVRDQMNYREATPRKKMNATQLVA